MFKIPFSTSIWLALYCHNIAGNIFSERIRLAAHSFLIRNKFSPKTFSILELGSYSTLYREHGEMKRLFRLFLTYLRKSIPLLKKEDLVYGVPYIQVIGRCPEIKLWLKISSVDGIKEKTVVERYLRKYKINEYLGINKVPLLVTLAIQETSLAGYECRCLYVRIDQPTFATPNVYSYKLVFLLPTLIKIFSTFHRKACIKDVSTINWGSTPTTLPAGDDFPF